MVVGVALKFGNGAFLYLSDLFNRIKFNKDYHRIRQA